MTVLPPRTTGTVPFAGALADFGHRTALVTAQGETSYRQLADEVAAAGRALGPTRRLVLLTAGDDVGTVVGYLAALAGGHPVLLAPPGDGEATAALISTYDPDVVARGAGATWRLEERRRGTAHDLHPELALLLSTSGSTGSPKLVRLSAENVQANAEAVATSLGVRDTDRAAATLPLHYCYGLSVLNSHLLRGAGVVLSGLSVVDPCFWRLFRRARATSLAGVPYTFDLLDRVGFARMDLPSLRYVTQAGGRLAPDRVREYARLGRRRGWDFVVMYGQTEATARMAYLPPDLAEEHPGAVGIPVPGGSFSLEPVADGERDCGELVYAGPNVMLGYATGPTDLALGRTVDVLRTGDLARRHPDGVYEIVGRRSRFVKIVGLRVDLQHVESLLAGTGLRACCAGDDTRLVVAVEAAGPADLVAARRLLVERVGLPRAAVAVHAVPALPRLPTGKPDLPAVLRLADPPETPPPGQPVPAAGAAALRDLYAELLDRPDATEESSFVGLGGDSLSYVEMSVRLEEALGDLPAGWHTATVRELAAGGPGPARRGHALETSVALRAVAITLVVGSHAWLFSVLGGAHVLLGVAGYNVARFQLTTQSRSRRARQLLAAARRIAVPSVVWIAGAYLLTDLYAPPNVVLLNAVLGPDTWGSRWHFWFIEALVYVLVVLAVLLGMPAVDRLERRFPFAVAMAFVGAATLPRSGLLPLDAGPVTQTPHTVFLFFALGWAAARAVTSARRLVVTAAVLGTVPGFFDDPSRSAVVVVGLLLLVWLPTVPGSRLVNRAAALLAGASLYVYLTHWVVIPHLDHVSPPLAVLASFALGGAYWALARWAGAVLRRVPRPGGSPARR